MLADGWDMPLATDSVRVAGSVKVGTANPWLRPDASTGAKAPPRTAAEKARDALIRAERAALVKAGVQPNVPAFEAAPRFDGPRPGMVFKSGERGVGYYADSRSSKRQTTDDTTSPKKKQKTAVAENNAM